MAHFIEAGNSNLKDLREVFDDYKKSKSDNEDFKDSIQRLLDEGTSNMERYRVAMRRRKDKEKMKSDNKKMDEIEKELKEIKAKYSKLKKKFKEKKNVENKNDLLKYTASSDEEEKDKKKDKKQEEGEEEDDDEDFAPDRSDEDLGEPKNIEETFKSIEPLTEMEEEELALELFKDVFKVQDGNIDIARRLVKKADQGISMASHIIEQIEYHNERLRGISSQLDSLDGQITRASVELYGFARGAATEYAMLVCIYCCFCWIFVVVVIVIACKAGLCNLICDSITDAAETCQKIPGLYTISSGVNPSTSLGIGVLILLLFVGV